MAKDIRVYKFINRNSKKKCYLSYSSKLGKAPEQSPSYLSESYLILKIDTAIKIGYIFVKTFGIPALTS